MTGSLEKKRSGKRDPAFSFLPFTFPFLPQLSICLSVSPVRAFLTTSPLFPFLSRVTPQPPSNVLPPSSSLLPPSSSLLPPPTSSLLPPTSSLLPPSLLSPTYSLDSNCHIPMVPLRSHWISKCHIEATCKCYLLTFNVKWSHANVCLMWHL
jgi:hypothetical protein